MFPAWLAFETQEVKWAVSVELRRSNVIRTLGLWEVTSSACVHGTLAYAFKVYFLLKDEEPSCGQLPQMGGLLPL